METKNCRSSVKCEINETFYKYETVPRSLRWDSSSPLDEKLNWFPSNWVLTYFVYNLISLSSPSSLSLSFKEFSWPSTTLN